MKKASDMPADLDSSARKKWRELIEVVDADVDRELLANYCRMYSGLMAIRAAKAQQIKAGSYETLVPGRDGTMQLNPLQTAENRMVSSLNRMLKSLGLAQSREEQEHRKKKQLSSPPPPGFSGPEPAHGWAVELALCGDLPAPSPAEQEAQRRCKANQALLARNDWRAYEKDFDPGIPPRKD